MSTLIKGNKAAAGEGNANLWNSARFSDLLIKFSGREVRAHRLILCQGSTYFDKLCGPESPFAVRLALLSDNAYTGLTSKSQEANKSEIELQDDDPDALEAMLRHLYGARFTPPALSLKPHDKVRYYCNVVVVADKYGLFTLAQQAHASLKTFVTSLEEPSLLLEALVILTDEYHGCESLEQSAMALARPRLKGLVSIPSFPAWLTKRTRIIQDLVDDATEFRTKFKFLKPMQAWQCAFCKNIMLVAVQPKCCRYSCGRVDPLYVRQSVHGPSRPSTHHTSGQQ